MLDTTSIEFSMLFKTFLWSDVNIEIIVQNKKDKADLLYLRGKALDYLPEYSKNAEEFLSKAIKLLPSKQEAWDALGHVYWKKHDL